MQDQNNNNHPNYKEFYTQSVLKNNLVADFVHELTGNEHLDLNVEKFIVEMGDDFIDSILEMGCQLAKHRKAEVLSVNEIIYSMEKNYDIIEPNKTTQNLQWLKSNELKNISTADHKKRVELTREECKI